MLHSKFEIFVSKNFEKNFVGNNFLFKNILFHKFFWLGKHIFVEKKFFVGKALLRRKIFLFGINVMHENFFDEKNLS